MADTTPPMTVSLAWDGNLEFTGQAGKHEVGLDGATYTAPSPMQLLALSVAGCMAIDIVHIVTRGRHRLVSLEATCTGERAAEAPKCFRAIVLHFVIGTDAAPAVIERAIQLSRGKYCSVWNSLRQDITLTTGFEIRAV